MKSITVTTHRSINYGAVLQAYALQQAQEWLGVENLLLDMPSKKDMYEPLTGKFSKRTLVSMAVNLSWMFHSRDMKLLVDRFNQFVNENIKTTKAYRSWDELLRDPPEADMYISGSDQVFGLRGKYDDMRMLRFGSETIKRFSFAASLGEYDWSDDEKGMFAELLQRFSMVSVREKYAKEYIESFSDVNCEVNIDPVFLLDKEQWSEIAVDPSVKEKYILCYPLIGNSDTQKVLNQLKEKTGYKTVSMQTIPIKRVKTDEYVLNAGPKEFLSLIKNAEYIVTTSFHGTAFSIIFEKPFYTLIKNYKSQRMTDLLELVGLSNRLYTQQNGIEIGVPDFTYARKVINIEKKRSIDYLSRVIKSVEF